MMIVQTDLYVIQNRQVAEQTDILEGTGNACLADLNGLFSGKVLSIQENASIVRFVYTGQQIEYGCFSCSVGADQTIQFSFFDGNMKFIHSTQAAEGDPQIVYFQ